MVMLRLVIALAVLLASGPAASAAAQTVAVAQCADLSADAQTAVGACTELIRSASGGPSVAALLVNRGAGYLDLGRYRLAGADFAAALHLDATLRNAYAGRALTSELSGQYQSALADLQQALRIDPGYAFALAEKAWILSTCPDAKGRDGAKAVALAQRAVQLEDNPSYQDVLAAAYAEAGRYEDAVKEEVSALVALRASDPQAKRSALQDRLALYNRKMPYRAAAMTSALASPDAGTVGPAETLARNIPIADLKMGLQNRPPVSPPAGLPHVSPALQPEIAAHLAQDVAVLTTKLDHQLTEQSANETEGPLAAVPSVKPAQDLSQIESLTEMVKQKPARESSPQAPLWDWRGYDWKP
jgi:tetratricopeptide (TPR) repeat protein